MDDEYVGYLCNTEKYIVIMTRGLDRKAQNLNF